MAELRALAPVRRRRPPTDGARGPHLVFFSIDGEVAAAYRRQLPEGWRFSTLRDRSDEAEKLRLLADADVVLHIDTPLTAAHLEGAPYLALVHRQGVGVDAVDDAALREHGVALAICPDGTAEAVAEHTILLMLAAARHLVQLHQDVTVHGAWPKLDYRMRSLGLHGSTVGLVGFGRIGQAVARRVTAFGSRVLVHRRVPAPFDEEWAGLPIEACPELDDLFARSDVVSLHCPLLPESRGMVDGRRLALMSTDSVLVNTSRGGLVVEPDLVAALRSGRPAAAGLDVLAQEPPARDNPLLSLSNVVLTPHCGAGSRQAQMVKVRAVMDNVARFWAGQPIRSRVL